MNSAASRSRIDSGIGLTSLGYGSRGSSGSYGRVVLFEIIHFEDMKGIEVYEGYREKLRVW